MNIGEYSPRRSRGEYSPIFTSMRRIITQVIIEIPKQRNVKFHHNLPLFIRLHTTLLASMCHAMPFSARALKKHLTFIPCGKKQTEMWFIVVYTLIDNEYASVLFSKTIFFLIASAC